MGTRGWLPQRAGSPNLNGGGATAAVYPTTPQSPHGIAKVGFNMNQHDIRV